MQNSECRASQSQIQENPLKNTRAYRFKREVVHGIDRIMTALPLGDTQLNMGATDDLEELLGDGPNGPAEHLEHLLVESRWRIFGTAIKLAGQIGYTANLALGSASPEFLIGTYLGSELGKAVEIEANRKSYIEIAHEAFVVLHRLFLNHLPDFYRWTPEKQLLFPAEVAEAIARSAAIGRPPLGTALYAALNGLTLLFTGQPPWSYLGLGLTGTGVIYRQNRELKNGRELIEHQQKDRAQIVSTQRADDNFGTAHDIFFNSFSSESDLTKRWTEGASERIFLRVAMKAGIPIAVLTKSLGALYLTILGEFASQLLRVDDQRGYFSTVQVGLTKLHDALKIIRENNISLIPESTLQAHCDEFRQTGIRHERESEVEGWFAQNPDAVAWMAPHDVVYPDKEGVATVSLPEPLLLKAGVYFGQAPTGKGQSSFLNGLLHRVRPTEKGESYIRVAKGGSHQKLHDLTAAQIKSLFVYISPEPVYSELSAEALFVPEIKYLIPEEVSGNPLVNDILKRFHTDNITADEHYAIVTCARLLAGLNNHEEILAMKLPRKVRALVNRLLPYFDPVYGRKWVIEEMKKNDWVVTRKGALPLFNDSDFQAITDASMHTKLPRSTKAKLRLMRIIRKAVSQNVKVIGIDQTIDPLDDEETEVIVAYMSGICDRENISIIIFTHEDQNKQIIKKYIAQGEIFFNKDKPTVDVEYYEANKSQ